MKLVRFGTPGEERPGIWLEDEPDGPAILDVRATAFDIRDYDSHFFGCWGLERLRGILAERKQTLVSPAGLRLGPPVARPGKVMCVGKNYAEHAAELGTSTSETPIFFAKAATAINGPFDPIVIPPDATTVDTEVELAVVIGRRAYDVTEDEAMTYVAGYTVMNDVTDRATQRTGKQWFRGKNIDTFGPLGPFLVTADEVDDPHNLRLYSAYNEELMQEGHTGGMNFRIPVLLAALSRMMTLEPGDLIATGTPAGVGSAQEPPRYLKPGDTVEVGVEGVCVQVSPVVGGGGTKNGGLA